MTIKDLSDDQLNLFIDEELDTDELNEIRQAVMEDKDLRERVCQLKAVRELIGYAYSDVPGPDYENQQVKKIILYVRQGYCCLGDPGHRCIPRLGDVSLQPSISR